MLDWVIKLLSFYGNSRPADIESKFSHDNLLSVGADLQLFPVTFGERLARKYLGRVLDRLSPADRSRTSSFFKRVRRRQRRFQIRYPKDLAHNILFAGLIRGSGFKWSGHKSVVCFSYDVDNAAGYRFLERQADISKRYRIPGTINFLTNGGYSIDHGLINALISEGNEIGLHGYTHDAGFAYRPARVIKKNLSCALRDIGVPVLGFRAPALSGSPQLLDAIEESGLSYDSTFQTLSRLYRSTGLNLPYQLYGRRLWEFPIAVQDDYFFRDFGLSDEEALGVLKRVLSEIHELGAMAVLVFHPHIVEQRVSFYEALLDFARSMDNSWLTTTGNLFKFIQDKYNGQNSGFYIPADKGTASS
jgi:peptidoglycan/xylan/chitin deacetylase (PgdA/CDA1 family)